jgi:hypothetical protein
VLEGPLDLTGRVTATDLSASLEQPPIHRGGKCADMAARTDRTFIAKLPDGSAFKLVVGLPPAAGGAGTYHRPQVSISADATNKTSSISWSAVDTTSVNLVVREDGGGLLDFAGLASGTAGEAPLGGHLEWDCTMA